MSEIPITRPCPDPDCGGLAVRTYDHHNGEYRWRCGDCGVWWSEEFCEKSSSRPHLYEKADFLGEDL